MTNKIETTGLRNSSGLATQSGSFKLTPSDFAFLWEECQRCFYLKLRYGFDRPRTPMAKIFSVIDSKMKTCYHQKRTETVVPGMPKGVFLYGEKWVHSKEINFPNRRTACFIRGKFDTVIQFDDGTYGVVDFKTCHRQDEHVPLYGRQLHAYALALENPSPGKFALAPISKLGLLVFEPSKFQIGNADKACLDGVTTWIEVSRDDAVFTKFLKDVVSVLDAPDPPAAGPTCQWCMYREASRNTTPF